MGSHIGASLSVLYVNRGYWDRIIVLVSLAQQLSIDLILVGTGIIFKLLGTEFVFRYGSHLDFLLLLLLLLLPVPQ